MTDVLRLRLFGGFLLSRGTVPLPGLSSGKARALLGYLAVADRPHARTALAGLLWGERSEEAAAANLRVVLGTLHHALPDHLIITRQTISFNREAPYWLDVEAFQAPLPFAGRAASGLDVAAVEDALRLYQGDFLDGFYVHKAPAFEEWVWGQRELFRRLALQALHVVIAYHETRGEYAVAINFCSRLLALEPWQEEMHRKMMVLLALDGQIGAALAHYETCRRILAEELRAEPAPETKALYEQIRGRGQQEQIRIDHLGLQLATRPHNLPFGVTPFVGREAELAQIATDLANPSCRLLTLAGPAGSGKTRLAVQAAADAISSFFHGVWFVSLAAATTAGEMGAAILQALQVLAPRGGDAQEALTGFLHDKQALLLLDQIESPAAGAALVQALLAAAPQVKFLVTARSRLEVAAEWAVAVAGLAYAGETATGGPGPALRLLLARLDTRASGSAPGAATRDMLTHLCRLVAGLPLAIELLAAALRVEEGEAILGEVRWRLEGLGGPDPERPERALTAVLACCAARLPAGEREALVLLAGGSGGPGRRSLARGASTTPAWATLAGKGFLQEAPAGCYTLHAAVRAFFCAVPLAGAAAPVPAGTLVDRLTQQTVLRAVWRQVTAGAPRLVVLQGAPGAGKTCLAEDLLAWAETQGGVVARARAYNAEGTLAYGPVAEWLRASALQPAWRGLAAVWRSEIARLVPDLLAEPPAGRPAGPPAESWQRTNLLQALAHGVLGDRRPRLLLLDDLHWCDIETLQWLRYLLRCDRQAPLLLLATVSPGESAADGPLAAFLSEIDRSGQLTTLLVPQLDAAATAVLAAQVAGHALDAATLATLYAASEGNPLFIREMVRAGVAAEVPPAVRAVLRAWLRPLSPAARTLLELAASAGRVFTFAFLRTSSAFDDEALVCALDELCRRGIICEQGEDEYSFSHGQLRAEVLRNLSRARRALLQARVLHAPIR